MPNLHSLPSRDFTLALNRTLYDNCSLLTLFCCAQIPVKTFQAAANAVVSGPMPEKGHDGHNHHHHHAGHEERPFSFANAQPLKVRMLEPIQGISKIFLFTLMSTFHFSPRSSRGFSTPATLSAAWPTLTPPSPTPTTSCSAAATAATAAATTATTTTWTTRIITAITTTPPSPSASTVSERAGSELRR